MTPARKTGKTLMQERWLSVQEIAAHLGVNRDTIYKWIERKRMPAHNVGRLWKFLGSEVDQWVKAGHAAKDVPTNAPQRKLPRC
jgi:excisionase family DNA binding protein